MQQTAAALNDQTRQLNKIVDDLADIEFNVKKATKVIGDITRGLLTDK
jgi:novel plant SNARE